MQLCLSTYSKAESLRLAVNKGGMPNRCTISSVHCIDLLPSMRKPRPNKSLAISWHHPCCAGPGNGLIATVATLASFSAALLTFQVCFGSHSRRQELEGIGFAPGS